MEIMKLNEQITFLRKQKGMTQEEVACADSHLDTAWFVTPRAQATSSCVIPFCFLRKEIGRAHV